jgi:hypothetical protein
MDQNLDKLWNLDFEDFIVGETINGYENPCEGQAVGAFPPQDSDPLKKLDDLLKQYLGEPIDLQKLQDLDALRRQQTYQDPGPKPPLANMDQPSVPRPGPSPLPGSNPGIDIGGDYPYSAGGSVYNNELDWQQPDEGWNFRGEVNPYRTADDLTRAVKSELQDQTNEVAESNGECASDPTNANPTPTTPTLPSGNTQTGGNPSRPSTGGGGGGTGSGGGGGGSTGGRPVGRSPVQSGTSPIR